MAILATLLAAAFTLQPFGEVKVVDEIDCSKAGVKAKYYVLVHKGLAEKHDVTVKLPSGGKSSVEFPVYGKSKALKNGALVFKTLKPVQIVSFRR